MPLQTFKTEKTNKQTNEKFEQCTAQLFVLIFIFSSCSSHIYTQELAGQDKHNSCYYVDWTVDLQVVFLVKVSLDLETKGCDQYNPIRK